VLFRIPEPLVFPDPTLSEPSGLLGVGGDLSAGRLLLAYRSGIFPWYSDGQPILWWSPDPRMVLHVDELEVPRSLAKRVRQGRYRITLDQAFGQVIRRCRSAPRPGQNGTWLTAEMVAGYEALHALGHAHSVEAWSPDGELVGGLYGVAVGKLYCGESMFADAPDASKVAFVHLVGQLRRWGYPLVDCQVYTEHLARFGAQEIPRVDYLKAIAALVDRPGRVGPWSFDADYTCDGRPR
jgi:leucyl/phenylalanyl-tRNA--protein transferase